MNGKTMGILGSVLGIFFVGMFLLGLTPTASIQSTQEMPLAKFVNFEMYVSTLTQTPITASGYAGYNHVKIRNTSLTRKIWVGNSDVLTSTGTTVADMRKTGFEVGESTSTYNTLELNTSVPVYAIGEANLTSSSTICVILGNW